jgi:hypothetical protein
MYCYGATSGLRMAGGEGFAQTGPYGNPWVGRRWRRGRDSNPRRDEPEAVFKTAALNHSATPPSPEYRRAN